MANFMRFRNRWECLVGRHCDDNYLIFERKKKVFVFSHIFVKMFYCGSAYVFNNAEKMLPLLGHDD